MRAAVALLLGAGAVAGLAACTAGSAAPSTTTPPTTVPVSVPTGTPAELFPELLAEMGALSERVVQNDGDDEALSRIDALWTALRPQVEAEHPELLVEFDATIAYAHRAVERRRPADADKGAINLRSLVDAY